MRDRITDVDLRTPERDSRIADLEMQLRLRDESIAKLETDLKNNNNSAGNQSISTLIHKANIDKNGDSCTTLIRIKELEDLIVEKDRKIAHLEDGLRETVEISTEREVVLQKEEAKRRHIMEKVGKLEQRLLSLQSAQALRCHNCKPYVRRTSLLEEKLFKLVAERRKNLRELSLLKREALEAAISEKDSHLALLEITGIRNARQAEEADSLRSDKKRLVEMLKKEAESSITLMAEESEDDELSRDIIEQELPSTLKSP